MKLLHLFFIYILFFSLVLIAFTTSNIEEEENYIIDTSYEEALEEGKLDAENDFLDDPSTETDQSSVVGRILLQKKRARRLTCNKFPMVCHAKGSPGPHRVNCGFRGKKCKYGEICCSGKCVSPFFSRKHCGGCNKKCSICVFGLCNYA